jgi:hypothetical protein
LVLINLRACLNTTESTGDYGNMTEESWEKQKRLPPGVQPQSLYAGLYRLLLQGRIPSPPGAENNKEPGEASSYKNVHRK